MTSPFRNHSRYARALEENPALLRDAEADQRGDGGKASIIRVWDEIPDAMMMGAPKIEWVVEGIIPRASVTLLAGEPGSYKSWLALSLLRAVSTGERFLDQECKAAGVLYLDRGTRTVPRELRVRAG